MKMEDELYDFIYRSVYTAVIALFIFFEVYDYVDPGLITRGNIFSVIIISLSFNALLWLWHKVRMYLIPAVLVVGLILYFMIDREDAVMIVESTVFSLMMICLVSFLLFLVCDRYTPFGMTVAAGAFVYMLVTLFLGYPLYKASPVLIIFYLLSMLTKVSRNGFSSAGRKDLPEHNSYEEGSGSLPERVSGMRRTRQYMTFLLPFLLAFLLLLTVFPKPGKPISWKWVLDIYEYTSEKIEILMHRISSRYGTVTTSGSFRIAFDMAEKLTYDNSGQDVTELMEVTPEGTVFGSLYLKGEVFNEFRDGQWFNTLETDRDYSMIDAFETYLGVANYGEAPVNTLIRETSLKIRFLDISTPIVFAPVKINLFSDISTKKKTEYVNEHLLLTDNASYGSEYNVAFLQMNLGNTVFNDYMSSLPGTVDPVVFENSKKNLRGNYSGLKLEDLEEYHGYITQYYTSAPEIRDSVKQWIADVCKDAGTDYEKLLKLEQALAGFDYDLNTAGMPGYVHSEGDFLDHFILEKREGYCVHYATAFCLLARYLGYPARVVRGYKTEAQYNETAVINNGCGHAWPEVYFEGRGWIPFEPTPGMAGERYGGWAVKAGKIKNDDYFHARTEEQEPVIPVSDPEYEREHIESKASGILIFTIFAIVIISLVLLLLARLLIGRSRLKKMSEQERYYAEFDRLLLILSQLGKPKEPQETLAEYAIRLEDVLTGEKNAVLEKLKESGVKGSKLRTFETIKEMDTAIFGKCIETHEKCLYGGMQPAHKEVLKVGRCEVEAEKLLKSKYGKSFILYKLRMFVMYGF